MKFHGIFSHLELVEYFMGYVFLSIFYILFLMAWQAPSASNPSTAGVEPMYLQNCWKRRRLTGQGDVN